MSRLFWVVIAVLGLLGVVLHDAAAQPSPRPRQGNLKANDDAPDFSIKDVEGKMTTRLAELKGKPVVLIFGSCT
jgi:cytochrome oxidase Cu insertion factor (SCO1/SenC/PrrC family)